MVIQDTPNRRQPGQSNEQSGQPVQTRPLDGSNEPLSLVDSEGFALTVASREAAAHFRDGMSRMRRIDFLDTSVADAFRRAVASDSQFVLGHLALAYALQPRRPDEARTHIQTAATLARTIALSPRERRHVEVAVLAADGEAARALALACTHLDEFPRDEMMLRRLGALNGRLGGPDRQQRGLALYARFAPHYQNDAWFLGQYGFMHVAARHFAEARPLIERALALEPHSGMHAHTFAHLCQDSGDPAGGAAFLRVFLRGDDPGGGFHTHNTGHLIVFELELGRIPAALAAYERGIVPALDRRINALFDAVTLLWRCTLFVYGQVAGVAGIHLPWDGVQAPAQRHMARAASTGNTGDSGGMDGASASGLMDVACAMAFTGAGNDESLDNLIARLRQDDPAVHPASAGVVLPLVLGLRAFWSRDFHGAVKMIEPVLPSLARIGGGPMPNSVFEDTLIEAHLRTGQFVAAESLLRRRLAGGTSPRDLFWLGRAQAGLEQREDAAASLAAAREGWRTAGPDSPELAALSALAVSLSKHA